MRVKEATRFYYHDLSLLFLLTLAIPMESKALKRADKKEALKDGPS